MVHYCIVYGCNSHSKRHEVSFHHIPAIVSPTNKKYQGVNDKISKMIKLSEKRQKAWVSALNYGNLSETQLKTYEVCGKHFLNGKPASFTDENHPDWVPCVNLGYISKTKHKNNADLKRHERLVLRAITDNSPEISISEFVSDKMNESVDCSKKVSNNSSESMDVDNSQEKEVRVNECVVNPNHPNNPNVTNKSTQTDLDMNELCSMMNELTNLKETNERLNNQIAISQFHEEAFINDDKKTKFYTGLSSYQTLKAIHDIIHPFLSNSTLTRLTTFQQLILTLIKLRLNLSFVDLAYRFCISIKTVSQYFRNVLHVIFWTFKYIVHWPDRDILQSTMPACFKEVFGNKVTVIIDCFEIFIEHPSNLSSAATCWSNYKHHVTAKVLIGITPQGSICFVSEAWGGRVSDKVLTENSGFLDKLLPGDTVLADRGFLIQESVETLHASLLIPAFTKGKSQLHPIELEESRNVAHVRIHVERVIGCLRQIFLILSAKLPITMLVPDEDGNSIFDKIVFVCACLFNLLPGVVSLG